MKLPPLKLRHLQRLTDERGIVQFAPLGVPDPATGYATDDSTRALVVTARLPHGGLRKRLAATYVRSILHAQRPDGMLAQETAVDGSLSDAPASDDAFGRLIWACGEVAGSDLPTALKHTAAIVVDRARPHVARIGHVRGWSSALQGLALLAHYAADRWAEHAALECAGRIVDELTSHSAPGWVWFEDVLTYEPGRLPLSLLHAAALTRNERYLETAEQILAFLERSLYEVTPQRRIFTPAGNRGWCSRGGVRATYDQQPIDAGSMVEAAVAAGVLTGNPRYRRLARDSFEWFLGANVGGVRMYDQESGACHDGLTPHGINLNAGAESTICYLIARLTITAKALPISRLRAARTPIRELHDGRHAETDRALQEHVWQLERPTAGPRPEIPSRR